MLDQGHVDRFACQDLLHQSLDFLGISQLRQWSLAARQVGVRRDRNPQCTEAVMTRVEQKVQHCKARRLVEEADDPFAPAVWLRVIHGSDSGFLLDRKELTAQQGQILAERKSRNEPGW